MSDTINLVEELAQTISAPTRRPLLMNMAQAERITSAGQILTFAAQDPTLLAALAPFGYDTEKIAEGLALQHTASQIFMARQELVVARSQAAADLNSRFIDLDREYMDYRRIGRSLFPMRETRLLLGLSGKFPHDQQQFAQFVRTLYHLVLQTVAYAEAFETRGYTPEKFTVMIADLDAWVAAWAAYSSAHTEAIRATQQRDSADAALKVWMQQFRAVAHIAARTHPEVVVKLDL